jgi:hypothetical protein
LQGRVATVGNYKLLWKDWHTITPSRSIIRSHAN